jgi:hypothetical protein
MTEQFAISFSPDDPNLHTHGDLTDAIVLTVQDDFRASGFNPEEVDLSVASAGYGADATLVLAVVAGLGTLFLSGKRIEENLDAWAKLGKRFKEVCERLKRRHGAFAMSQPVALAVILDHVGHLAQEHNRIEVIGSHTLPVRNSSIPGEMVPHFQHQPDRFYVFVLKTSIGDTYVAGMRSTGDITFLHRVATGNWWEYISVRDNTPAET